MNDLAFWLVAGCMWAYMAFVHLYVVPSYRRLLAEQRRIIAQYRGILEGSA